MVSATLRKHCTGQQKPIFSLPRPTFGCKNTGFAKIAQTMRLPWFQLRCENIALGSKNQFFRSQDQLLAVKTQVLQKLPKPCACHGFSYVAKTLHWAAKTNFF